MYTCICLHMHFNHDIAYSYTQINVYIHKCIYNYKCVLYVYLCTCRHAYGNACPSAYMYIYIHVCIHTDMVKYVHSYAYMYTHSASFITLYIYTCKYTFIYVCLMYLNTQIFACMYVICVCMYIHIDMSSYILYA